MVVFARMQAASVVRDKLITPTYDKGLLVTDLKVPGHFDAAERERINFSIKANGMAVIRNFVDKSQTQAIHRESQSVCNYGYGVGTGVAIKPYQDPKLLEFRFPFICSRGAAGVATNESLISLLEEHLGKEPLIHNALFQITFPREDVALGYHVDYGSVKALNPGKKLPDYRLRTILYLNDVESGGFSYILNSHSEAFKAYFHLPYSQLFPEENIPTDLERRVTIHEPAGTLIIFNTHGLHSPTAPRKTRSVLNIWFAKRDFSGNLPATLFALNFVPPDRRHRLHVFDSERGCSLDVYHEALSKQPSTLKAFLKYVLAKRTKSNYAHFE